jgi:membrane fusion protein (multidrug efflux system)
MPRHSIRLPASLTPVLATGLLASTLVLGACSGSDKAATPPPPEVGIVVAKAQTVTLQTELPGRLEPFRVAEVRARVAGIVQKRMFTEGSDVKAGQTLYAIDAQPYQAAVDNAAANLERAKANLIQASAQAKRYKPLVAANAVSELDFINAKAAEAQAKAEVAAGEAALKSARIDLAYASVTAPIAGRIGRALVTEGALVGQGTATPLATVQQIDPMYVSFTQPAAAVLQLRKAIASGELRRNDGSEAAIVQVLFDDGSSYSHDGKMLFADLTVDQTTGQISLRAQVPNPDGLLLPGMYVRVRLPQAQTDGAILLPQQAVTRNAQGDSVMVVDDKGQVAARKVTIDSNFEGKWIVTAGIKAGEQIMVDGFQKIHPGAPVKAVPWDKTDLPNGKVMAGVAQ